MNVSELPVRIGRIEEALQSRAAAAAANAMAAEFHRELVGVTLRKSSHPAGTDTPAPPGSPPALVSGTLRRSAQILPARAAGPRAVSGVRVGVVYARIQEKGGTVTAKRAKVLANRRTGQVFGKSVRLPARPYMKPTRDLLVATRRLVRVAREAVEAAAREGGA